MAAPLNHKQKGKGCAFMLFLLLLLGKKTSIRHSLALPTRIGSHECDLAARETGKWESDVFHIYREVSSVCEKKGWGGKGSHWLVARRC